MSSSEPLVIAENAAAKINLALAVTGRRPDGYHLIDTLAVFARIGDRLGATLAEELSLDISGPFGGDLPDSKSNLVMRASEALRAAVVGTRAPASDGHQPDRHQSDDNRSGAHLHLEKHLPVASGIGGGSADAAAALRALNRLWRVDWALPRLAELGCALGADVPMCLYARPLRARGIGEEIALLPAFPELHLVLANPGVAVSTAEIFARLDGCFSQALPGVSELCEQGAVVGYLRGTSNDLEGPAIAAAPVIADVLAALRESGDCQIARMSGSGATCFGIYPDAGAAKAAAAAISSQQPDWWVNATTAFPG